MQLLGRVREAPLPVTILAVLTFVGGFMAAYQTLAALLGKHWFVDFGFIGLFIGPGLLRGSRRWRMWALVLAWLLAAISVLMLLVVLGLPMITTNFRLVGVSIVAAIFSYSFWSIWVLNRYINYFQS